MHESIGQDDKSKFAHGCRFYPCTIDYIHEWTRQINTRLWKNNLNLICKKKNADHWFKFRNFYYLIFFLNVICYENNIVCCCQIYDSSSISTPFLGLRHFLSSLLQPESRNKTSVLNYIPRGEDASRCRLSSKVLNSVIDKK